jgi:hypothetical protein
MIPAVVNIVAARQVEDYSVLLRFDDESEQIVDFKPFLSNSVHPDIRVWLEPDKFSAFRVEYGELVWGDYELCFPVIDLYRNDLEHRSQLQAVA